MSQVVSNTLTGYALQIKKGKAYAVCSSSAYKRLLKMWIEMPMPVINFHPIRFHGFLKEEPGVRAKRIQPRIQVVDNNKDKENPFLKDLQAWNYIDKRTHPGHHFLADYGSAPVADLRGNKIDLRKCKKSCSGN